MKIPVERSDPLQPSPVTTVTVFLTGAVPARRSVIVISTLTLMGCPPRRGGGIATAGAGGVAGGVAARGAARAFGASGALGGRRGPAQGFCRAGPAPASTGT